MRIVQLSDIHVWRWPWRPHELVSKRAIALWSLAKGRAKRFDQSRLPGVIERVRSLEADHILITGDLTTSALPSEFAEAARALAPLTVNASRVTILPGNHDRYTLGSVRQRLFERTFGCFAPDETSPWVRPLDECTAIVGLDGTRAHWDASGILGAAKLARLRSLLADRPAQRLIIANHYPIRTPDAYRRSLAVKRLVDAERLADILRPIGPHLYCCGHIHAPWTFRPKDLPDQLCINAGAPLLTGPHAVEPPGFQEIVLEASDVRVVHHGWTAKSGWRTKERTWPGFFAEVATA